MNEYYKRAPLSWRLIPAGVLFPIVFGDSVLLSFIPLIILTAGFFTVAWGLYRIAVALSPKSCRIAFGLFALCFVVQALELLLGPFFFGFDHFWIAQGIYFITILVGALILVFRRLNGYLFSGALFMLGSSVFGMVSLMMWVISLRSAVLFIAFLGLFLLVAGAVQQRDGAKAR